MKKNMGMADRIIRIIVAILVGYLYYVKILTGPVGILGLLVAAVLVITSVFGQCPLYTLLGIKTCSNIQKQ